MKLIRNLTAAALLMCCVLDMTACGFYDLFVDENDTSSGVYVAIYNKDSADEELSAISDVSFMKGDLRNEIKEYDLSFEVTLSFDLETNDEASLSFYYYHNREDENAADYCQIGNSYLGTYTMEGDKIKFVFEEDGYNTAFYNVGSDYAGLDVFRECSYAEDGSCGIWAYQNTTWEYEDIAVILEDVMKDIPAAMEITVSGRKIVSWKAED